MGVVSGGSHVPWYLTVALEDQFIPFTSSPSCCGEQNINAPRSFFWLKFLQFIHSIKAKVVFSSGPVRCSDILTWGTETRRKASWAWSRPGHPKEVTRHFWAEAAREFLSGQAATSKPPSLNPGSRKARSPLAVFNSHGEDLPWPFSLRGWSSSAITRQKWR